MKQARVTVKNEYGLHARPSSLLANLASQFKSNILIQKEDNTVSCKNIMNLLLLAAGKNTVLTVSADGEDEDKAIAEIVDLVEIRKFDED